MKKILILTTMFFVLIFNNLKAQNLPELSKSIDQLKIYLTMPIDVENELIKKSNDWLMESYVEGSFTWFEWSPGYVLEGNNPILIKLGINSSEKTRRDGAWMKGSFYAKSIFSTRKVNLFVYAYYEGNSKIFKWVCNDYPDCSF